MAIILTDFAFGTKSIPLIFSPSSWKTFENLKTLVHFSTVQDFLSTTQNDISSGILFCSMALIYITVIHKVVIVTVLNIVSVAADVNSVTFIFG